MGRFLYTVQDSKGDTASGSVEAGDENHRKTGTGVREKGVGCHELSLMVPCAA